MSEKSNYECGYESTFALSGAAPIITVVSLLMTFEAIKDLLICYLPTILFRLLQGSDLGRAFNFSGDALNRPDKPTNQQYKVK
jgi:hypothetical protein